MRKTETPEMIFERVEEDLNSLEKLLIKITPKPVALKPKKLPGGERVRVAGERLYKHNLKELVPGFKRGHLHKLTTAQLELGEDRIWVSIEGKRVGWITKSEASPYKEILMEMAARGEIATVRAHIQGIKVDDKPVIGVWLEMAAPDRLKNQIAQLELPV